jgi:hypothetical protein
MLGGEGEHLHAAFLESIHPGVRIEAGGVPGFVEAVRLGDLRTT